MELKQFKLTNEEEIICEVVDWGTDENENIVVRRALKIHAMEDIEQGMRYYTFKPWMSFEIDPDAIHMISPYHIIAESNPGQQAKDYFFDVIDEMKELDGSQITSLYNEDDSDNPSLAELIYYIILSRICKQKILFYF